MHRLSLALAGGVAEHGLIVVASLRSTGSRVHGPQDLWHAASVVSACGLESMGSVVVAARLSRSMAYGILLDQGLNLCTLHWQADSYLLHHQGNPIISVP